MLPLVGCWGNQWTTKKERRTSLHSPTCWDWADLSALCWFPKPDWGLRRSGELPAWCGWRPEPPLWYTCHGRLRGCRRRGILLELRLPSERVREWCRSCGVGVDAARCRDRSHIFRTNTILGQAGSSSWGWSGRVSWFLARPLGWAKNRDCATRSTSSKSKQSMEYVT